jgi:hypothetical protein
MSYTINDEIKFSDSPNIDAFGRLRVSNPYSIFHSTNVSDSGSTEFETVLVGSGATTYNQDKAEIQYTVTASGDTVFREQHGYNHYLPGKSQLIMLTGVFGTGTTNVDKYMGYYNDDNGLAFMYSGTTFGTFIRTGTSGSPVDTFIPQTDWNIDTMITGNTLNPSGFHLDPSKTNIYIINFQWLGVGRIIFALDIDGVIYPVHQILNANNQTVVYMGSGNLPVRYEVKSFGGSDNTFKQICSTVISEGGQDEFGYKGTVSNALTTRTFSARQSVVSVRMSSTFNGVVNRAKAVPLKIEVLTTTNTVNAYWELVHQYDHMGETNLGGTPTWSVLSGTPLEYSVNGTTLSGGTVLASGYISTTTQTGNKVGDSLIIDNRLLALNQNGSGSDYLHLVVTPSVSSSWAGKITLKTLY